MRLGLAKLRYLRLRSFPTDTPEGRAAERYRLAAIGAIATVAARLASMALMVLTVRWAAPVLGAERFGVWATFSSMVAMLSFLDLGIGNALVNQVAHATAGGDAKHLSTVITVGLGWLLFIGLLASLILVAAGSLIPWTAFFKLSTPQIAAETRTTSIVFGALFGLTLVSGGLLKALAGQQRSYEAQLILVLSTLCSAPVVWYVVQKKAQVGTLLLAGFGLQTAITLMAGLLLLWMRRLVDFSVVVSSMRLQRVPVLASGSLFLFLQIGTMIGWGADSLLVASIAGAGDVAVFAVAQRLFQFASQPVAVVNSALWPAYADAFARDDRAFLGRTIRRSMLFSICLASGVALLLLFTGPFLIPYWTKSAIAVPWALLAAFAIWTGIESAGTALAAYLNGVGIVRIQVIVVIVFCVVALPAKIWGVRYDGATGLVIATSVSYVVAVYALYGIVFRRQIFQPISHK
jgi:O-antigen/teichoic acid export membrane protein